MRKLKIVKKANKFTAHDTMQMLDMFWDDFIYQNKFEFSLKSGIQLTVMAVSFESNYGGLIGYPTRRINEHIFQNWTYPSQWGKRKVYIIPPKEEEFNLFLKPFYCCVWLVNDKTVRGDQEYDISELVVIFSTNLLTSHSIQDLLQVELEDLDWENEAENTWCN